MVIENELFWLVILKTEFVHNNEVIPNNHFPSSERFIAGLNEYVCVCLFITNSSVCCGLVFVCSINVSVSLNTLIIAHINVNIPKYKYSNNFFDCITTHIIVQIP